MPLVDPIGHSLAHQVGADGKALQTVFVEDVPTALNVVIVLHGLVNFEMIAPAGDLDAVVAKRFSLFAKLSKVKSAHWPLKRVTGRAMIGFSFEEMWLSGCVRLGV